MKPKEYWLDLCGTLHGDPCDFVSVGKPHSDPASTNIHVIEYEAYHRACRETVEAEDKAQKALTEIDRLKAKHTEKYIDGLEDEIENLKAAYEEMYANYTNCLNSGQSAEINRLKQIIELLRQQRNEVAYHSELHPDKYKDWFKELDKEIEDKLK